MLVSMHQSENCHSSFVWVITTDDRTFWRGVGLALGCADDMFSGRAEAFGLLAALLFLQHYVASYGPPLFVDTSIPCFCNNLGIISTINDMNTTLCP